MNPVGRKIGHEKSLNRAGRRCVGRKPHCRRFGRHRLPNVFQERSVDRPCIAANFVENSYLTPPSTRREGERFGPGGLTRRCSIHGRVVERKIAPAGPFWSIAKIRTGYRACEAASRQTSTRSRRGSIASRSPARARSAAPRRSIEAPTCSRDSRLGRREEIGLAVVAILRVARATN